MITSADIGRAVEFTIDDQKNPGTYQGKLRGLTQSGRAFVDVYQKKRKSSLFETVTYDVKVEGLRLVEKREPKRRTS